MDTNQIRLAGQASISMCFVNFNTPSRQHAVLWITTHISMKCASLAWTSADNRSKKWITGQGIPQGNLHGSVKLNDGSHNTYRKVHWHGHSTTDLGVSTGQGIPKATFTAVSTTNAEDLLSTTRLLGPWVSPQPNEIITANMVDFEARSLTASCRLKCLSNTKNHKVRLLSM
jgi:hypothetical protein